MRIDSYEYPMGAWFSHKLGFVMTILCNDITELGPAPPSVLSVEEERMRESLIHALRELAVIYLVCLEVAEPDKWASALVQDLWLVPMGDRDRCLWNRVQGFLACNEASAGGVN